TILEGFDRHYRLFRAASKTARRHFERCDWKRAQREASERIAFYDVRVGECVAALLASASHAELTDDVWREVKLHYIGLLTDHKRPVLAETFFNSVCCRLLHRRYFNNDFIFVRPAISTEYIETEEVAPTYRVYYPGTDGLRYTLRRVVTNFQLDAPFEDLERDIGLVEQRLHNVIGEDPLQPNLQLQVLSSLFCRHKGVYIVAKVINGHREYPLIIPLLHGDAGLVLDTLLLEPALVSLLF